MKAEMKVLKFYENMELVESHFSLLDGNLSILADSYEMFSSSGKKTNVTYPTFLELFREVNQRELVILETGTANWGAKSTYLFDAYIRKYGGRLWSVDISAGVIDSVRGDMSPGTTLVCNDSVQFLQDWKKENPSQHVDIVYLDSYDVNFLNPCPAASHGMLEYTAIQSVLEKNTLLLIDDTPSHPNWLDFRGPIWEEVNAQFLETGRMPGKGMFIYENVPKHRILKHMYQLLYKF